MNPDLDVVPRALAGDREAFADLVAVYRREVEFVVLEYVGKVFPNEIEDAVQMVWIKLFERIDRFDPRRGVKFSTWLYSLARNQCLDILKKKRIPTRSLVRRSPDGEEFQDDLADVSPRCPENGASIRELVDRYRRASVILTEEQRIVFELHAAFGLEFSQIATRRRIPLGTAKTLFYRALAKLKDALDRTPRAA